MAMSVENIKKALKEGMDSPRGLSSEFTLQYWNDLKAAQIIAIQDKNERQLEIIDELLNPVGSFAFEVAMTEGLSVADFAKRAKELTLLESLADFEIDQSSDLVTESVD